MIILFSSAILLALLLLLFLLRSVSALVDLFVEYALIGAQLFIVVLGLYTCMLYLHMLFECTSFIEVLFGILAIMFVGGALLWIVQAGMVVLGFTVSIVTFLSRFISGATDKIASHIEKWFSNVVASTEKRLNARSCNNV